MGEACGRLELSTTAITARAAVLRGAWTLCAWLLEVATTIGATAAAAIAATVTAWGLPTTAAAIATGAWAAGCTTAALCGFVVTHALQHFCAGGLGGCLHDVTAWGFACTAPDGLAAHGSI